MAKGNRNTNQSTVKVLGPGSVVVAMPTDEPKPDMVYCFIRWKEATEPIMYPEGCTVWPVDPGLTYATIDLIPRGIYELTRDDLVSGYNGVAITEIQLIKAKE